MLHPMANIETRPRVDFLPGSVTRRRPTPTRQTASTRRRGRDGNPAVFRTIPT
jgi:hypothetical protein